MINVQCITQFSPSPPQIIQLELIRDQRNATTAQCTLCIVLCVKIARTTLSCASNETETKMANFGVISVTLSCFGADLMSGLPWTAC